MLGFDKSRLSFNGKNRSVHQPTVANISLCRLQITQYQPL